MMKLSGVMFGETKYFMRVPAVYTNPSDLNALNIREHHFSSSPIQKFRLRIKFNLALKSSTSHHWNLWASQDMQDIKNMF